jgi:hypothetical protein
VQHAHGIRCAPVSTPTLYASHERTSAFPHVIIMPNFWIHTPPDAALADIQAWAKTGLNQYAAIRHHLLVVPQNGGIKDGPIHRQMDWPVKAEFRMVDIIKDITRYTYTLQESITSSVTSKLSQELLTKINSSATLGVNKLDATLNFEVQAKIGSELVQALQRGLSTVSTYSVETERQKEEGLKFEVPESDGSKGTRPVFIYFKLRERFWDVYLYRTDYLQLEYKPNWVWPDVRKTIIRESVLLQQPLFRLRFYEPFPDFSFAFDQYQPEVENGDSASSVQVTAACPPVALPAVSTLEQLAKVAFPVSREEKDKAKKQKAQYAAGNSSALARLHGSGGGYGAKASAGGSAGSSARKDGGSSKATGSYSRSGGSSGKRAGSSSQSAGTSANGGTSSSKSGVVSSRSAGSPSRSTGTSSKSGGSSRSAGSSRNTGTSKAGASSGKHGGGSKSGNASSRSAGTSKGGKSGGGSAGSSKR